MNTRNFLQVVCLSAFLLVACGASSGGQSASATNQAAGTALPVGVAQEVINTLKPNLPDKGPAPELQNTVWLNSPQPLRLANLRGQVILLDMWTFDCINCQNVLPSVRAWYDSYGSKGLVVIGNHFPEFSYEADLANLKSAVTRLNVRFPVAQDNDGQTWQAYDTHYWPTIYLIDKRGHLRYEHIGEGAYAETEAAIQALLAESYS